LVADTTPPGAQLGDEALIGKASISMAPLCANTSKLRKEIAPNSPMPKSTLKPRLLARSGRVLALADLVFIEIQILLSFPHRKLHRPLAKHKSACQKTSCNMT
jgi:hypothetical protein